MQEKKQEQDASTQFRWEMRDDCMDNHTLTMNYAKQNDIDTFQFPVNITQLVATGDYVQTFRIPEGVKRACITFMALRNLHVPDSVESLNCSYNCLESLEVPASIRILDVSNNHCMRKLYFRGQGQPTDLVDLDISETRIESLDFPPPPNLEHLNINRSYVFESLMPKEWQDALAPMELDLEDGYYKVGETVLSSFHWNRVDWDEDEENDEEHQENVEKTYIRP